MFARFTKKNCWVEISEKLLRIKYSGYQLHTLFHWQPFIILSLSNVFICNNSRFHVFYSIFEDFDQTVFWHCWMSCLGIAQRVPMRQDATRRYVDCMYSSVEGSKLLIELFSVCAFCCATSRLSDETVIKMSQNLWVGSFFFWRSMRCFFYSWGNFIKKLRTKTLSLLWRKVIMWCTQRLSKYPHSAMTRTKRSTILYFFCK